MTSRAGTTRSTVNRILRNKAKRGTIKLERGRTIVLDREQLARRARWIGTRKLADAQGPVPLRCNVCSASVWVCCCSAHTIVGGRAPAEWDCHFFSLLMSSDRPRRVIKRRLDGAPHKTLRFVDATTGQNGPQQARLFNVRSA